MATGSNFIDASFTTVRIIGNQSITNSDQKNSGALQVAGSASIGGTLLISGDLFVSGDSYSSSSNATKLQGQPIDPATPTPNNLLVYSGSDWRPESNITVPGTLTVVGDLLVQGTQTIIDSTTVTTVDNVILINAGELGNGVTSTYNSAHTLPGAGIEVDRGSGTNYQFVFDETDDILKIGFKDTPLSKVTTRVDTMYPNGISYWVSNTLMNSTDFTYINGLITGAMARFNSDVSIQGNLSVNGSFGINNLAANSDLSTPNLFLGAAKGVNLRVNSAITSDYTYSFPASGPTGDAQVIATSGNTNVFYEIHPTNFIVVRQNPGPGEFSSVYSAIQSIPVSPNPGYPTDTNRYTVYVYPGIYTEPQIVLPSYVAIEGVFQTQTIIQADTSVASQTFIVGSIYAAVNSVTLGCSNPSLPPNYLVEYLGDPSGDHFRCDNVLFKTTGNIVHIGTTNGPGIFLLLNSLIDMSTPFINGIVIDDSGPSNNPAIVLVDNLIWSADSSGLTNFNTFLNVTSYYPTPGPFPNIVCVFTNSSIGANIPGASGTGISVTGNVFMVVETGLFASFNTAFVNPNSANYTIIIISATTFTGNNTDISIQSPSAMGTLACNASQSKVNIVSGASMGVTLNDPAGGIVLSGSLSQGTTWATVTDISDQIQHAAVTGQVDGPFALTSAGGLNVSVAAGSGYTFVGPLSSNYLQHTIWSSDTITLPDNELSWIYIDHSGNVLSSVSEPNAIQTILIGTALTYSGSVSYIQQIGQVLNNLSTNIDQTLRNGFGSIVQSGLIATPGSDNTKLAVNVSSGSYFYSVNNYPPNAGTNISMIGYYGDSTQTAPFTSVPLQWDSSGTLTAITSGYWVKHALYVLSDLVGNTKYFLVYGQQQFSSLLLAQTGNLPVPPATFVGNMVPISAIIVTNGDTPPLSSTRFLDIRPTLSFRSGTVTATADHNSLLNLTVGDAHTQYFRTDGTRVMAGDIQLGTNNITGAGGNLLMGVDITSHASRHLPGGADALATAAPVTIDTVNSIGIAASFSRSDHVHAHGAQTDPSMHAVATLSTNGFMSASDKSLLTSASVSDIPYSLVQQGANGEIRISTLYTSDILSGTATFNGATTFNGAATFNNTITTGVINSTQGNFSSDLHSGVFTATQGTFTSDLTVNSFTSNGNLSVQGNLTVAGNSTFNSDVTINAIISGRRAVFSSDLTSGVLTATQGTFGSDLHSGVFTATKGTFSSDLTVNSFTTNGNLSVQGTLTVAGNSTFNSDITINAITNGKRAVFSSDLTAGVMNGTQGNFSSDLHSGVFIATKGTFASDLTVNSFTTNGNLSALGTLSVTGTSTFNSDITINAIISGRKAVFSSDLTSGVFTATKGTFSSDLTVNSFTSNGNLSVQGTLTVAGNSTFNSDITINAITNGKRAVFSSDLTAVNTTVQGTLSVAGTSTFSSDITINAITNGRRAVFASDLTSGNHIISGTLSVAGNSTFNSDITINAITNGYRAVFTSDLTAGIMNGTQGNFSSDLHSGVFTATKGTFASDLTVNSFTSNGNLSVQGTLTVAGNSTFNSDITINAITNGRRAVFSSDLTAVNTTVQGTLTVAGNSTFNSDITINAITNGRRAVFSSDLTAVNTTVQGTLTVAGNSTFNSDISVAAITNGRRAVFASDLTANSIISNTTLTVTGVATFNSDITMNTLSLNPTNSISAAGSTQGTATLLTTSYNVVTTVAASTGVVFPSPIVGTMITVANRGANPLSVYPNSSAQIDALGNNVAVILPVNAIATYLASSATQWYTQSASSTFSGGLTAAGTTQATALALTSVYNVVTTAAASSGVALQSIATLPYGTTVTVVNRGANAITVYPFNGSSATIDAAVANAGVALAVNSTASYQVSGASTWVSVLRGIVAGTAVSVTFGNGIVTLANTGVTSLAGTANQITASAASGAVTLSIPAQFTLPGYYADSSNVAVSAAGTTYNTSTVLAKGYNVVTTVAAGSGVGLPIPVVGQTIRIVNKGANALLVYPATANNTNTIDGSTGAFTLPVNGAVMLQANTVTGWYTQDPVITGTANQISVAYNEGTTALSFPTAVTMPGTLTVTGNSTFNSDITINAITNGRKALFTSDLTAVNVTSTGTLSITGNSTFNSDITVNAITNGRKAIFTSDLTAVNVTSTGTLTIAGNSTFNSDITINAITNGRKAIFTSDLTAVNVTSTGTLTIAGNSTFNSDITINAITNGRRGVFTSDLTAVNVTSTGTLTIAGNSTFSSDIFVNAVTNGYRAVFTSDLTAKNVTSTGTLTVTGNGTFNSDITVNAITNGRKAVFASDLTAVNVTSTGTLTIAGNSTFNSDITVNAITNGRRGVFTSDLNSYTHGITATSNQLVLGTTTTSTISASTPASSRVYTIADPGANATFAMATNSATINYVLAATTTSASGNPTWQPLSVVSGVSSITGTANQISASASVGAVTLSLPSAVTMPGTLTVTNPFSLNPGTSITAAGSTQGTATLLANSYNVVTTVSSGTGVIFPVPIPGTMITITNKGANALNVYPNSSAQIDGTAVNNAVSLPVNATVTYMSSSTTQWYTTTPILSVGSGISVAYSSGSITIANTGVTSLASTVNQTSVNVSTGYVIVGISSTLVLPGTLTVPGNSTFNSDITVNAITNGRKAVFSSDLTAQRVYVNASATALSSGSATYTLNFNTTTFGNWTLALTASITGLTLSNGVVGGQYFVYITNTSGSTYNVTSGLGAGIQANWSGSFSIPTATTATMVITYSGTNYLVSIGLYQ